MASSLDCTSINAIASGSSAAFSAYNLRTRVLPAGQSVRMAGTVAGVLPDPLPDNNQASIP